VVGIAASNLTNNHGTVSVRLSCLSGQSYCDGTLALDTVRRFLVSTGINRARVSRPLVLGTQHFHVVGGHTLLVAVKLSRAQVGKLGKAGSTAVVIDVTARDAGGRRASSRRSVELVLRKAH